MADDGEVVLRIQALTKRFGEVTAVDRLSLDIRRGEFLTLLGPSGSGKSTTLHLIAGFERPTSGSIVLAGRSLAEVPAHQRHIGVVFQNYALFPHLTVSENIAFALRNLGWRPADIRERVEAVLHLVRLQGLGQRLPAQLSGGQQQRVAFGRAVAFRPSVLLLDEPLGALDKRLREEMLLELRHLHQTLGTTMVHVTHDQEEALVMSDRIVVMRGGRIVGIGPPRELYEDPGNRFVAEFLGDANLLDGEALPDGRVDLQGWTVRLPHDRPPGQRLTLLVRPEKLRLEPQGPDWNRAAVTIDEAVYLGGLTKYRLRTSHGQTLSVKTLDTAGVTLQASQSVVVGWRPEDGRVLAEEPGPD